MINDPANYETPTISSILGGAVASGVQSLKEGIGSWFMSTPTGQEFRQAEVAKVTAKASGVVTPILWLVLGGLGIWLFFGRR